MRLKLSAALSFVLLGLLALGASYRSLMADANLSDLASAAAARSNLGLGDAAQLNYGTAAGNLVRLDGSAKLPAVDGSQLTGISAGVSSFAGRTGAVVAAQNDYTFAQLASKPTTLSGYGITDAMAAITGMSQGAVLYYNGSSWTYLAAGTSGQFLKTFGPGANPAWASVSSGATAFTGLSDVPGSYSGQGGKLVKVNSGATGLEFASATGGGDVSGPASSTADHIATFSDGTGKTIKDGGALGGAAALNVGTGAGTVAAGDDSRIAGAAQKSLNLSDLSSASSARSNLGLGTAATGTTGTGSGNIPTRPASNALSADSISEISSGNGVSIDGVKALDSFLELDEIAAPSSPASDKLRLYAKDSSGTSKLYVKDSAGTETELGAGGSGSTSDTSRGSGTWTSTSSSPSQRAIEEALNDVGVEYAKRASALTSADHLKPAIAYNSLDTAVRLLLHLENGLTDSSAYSLSPSGSNLTYSSSVYKFGAYAASFNGSSTSISIPQAGGIPELGTSDFTIRGHFYGTSFGSFSQLFEHSKSTWDSSYRYFCDVKDYSGTKKIRFQYIVDGANYYGIDGATTVTPNAWHNFEVCRSGGVFYLFLDGNLEGSLTGHTTDSMTLSSPGDVHLGNQGNGANWWSGYMDDFEIILGSAAHTSSFTAPTAAYSIDGLKKISLGPISLDRYVSPGSSPYRLSPASGVWAPSTDYTAVTSIYAVLGHKGDILPLYDVTDAKVYPFRASELSLALSGYAANTNFDIFVNNTATGATRLDSPTLALSSVAWLDTAIRLTPLAPQNGMLVKGVPRSVVDSYMSGANNTTPLYSGMNTQYGQALALGSAYSISGARFWLNKTGSPTGNMYFKLYACTGTPGSGGVPTGSALATSGAISAATLSATAAPVEFTLATPYAASAGNYCVLIEYSGGDASNRVEVTNNMSGSHAGNQFYYRSGYSVDTGYDCYFQLIATIVDATAPGYRYLGTIRTTGTTGQTELVFSSTSRAPNLGIWNLDNRRTQGLIRKDPTASWSYSTAAWRQTNGSSSNQCSFVIGLVDDDVWTNVFSNILASSSNTGYIGIGINNSSAASAAAQTGPVTGTVSLSVSMPATPSLGYNYIAGMEYSTSGTYYGSSLLTGVQVITKY